MGKEDRIAGFDPNGVALGSGGIFGLPFTEEDAEIVLIPVPWDATVSFHEGTSNAPEAIMKASKQVDLYSPLTADAWKMGIFLQKIPLVWADLNRHCRKIAVQVIRSWEDGNTLEDPSVCAGLKEVNGLCQQLYDHVHKQSLELLKQGKLVGVVGGDHSSPLGLIKALDEQHTEFGILHIDAHADLRNAYEGFTYSHASIMYNAMQFAHVGKLVSVGLRDVCEEEVGRIESSNGRIVAYYDLQLAENSFKGVNWDRQCEEMIGHLPQEVYISFDIDGLDPKLCPATGTPVPGGLDFQQAAHLLNKVTGSGRRIIGFDLCEVTPGASAWDETVGARILYHLCNLTGLSNGRMA